MFVTKIITSYQYMRVLSTCQNSWTHIIKLFIYLYFLVFGGKFGKA